MGRLVIEYSTTQELVDKLEFELARARAQLVKESAIYEALSEVLDDIRKNPEVYVRIYGAKRYRNILKMSRYKLAMCVGERLRRPVSPNEIAPILWQFEGVVPYAKSALIVLNSDGSTNKSEDTVPDFVWGVVKMAVDAAVDRREEGLAVPVDVVREELLKYGITPGRATRLLKKYGIVKKRIRIAGDRVYVYVIPWKYYRGGVK